MSVELINNKIVIDGKEYKVIPNSKEVLDIQEFINSDEFRWFDSDDYEDVKDGD